ncbi:MAG: carboxypeptidase-like regulatory domain-containing protein, partial [Nonlabens ulvanivorans]|uniref:carboxypeptidase-like regulatory domain-containing protein n=1 Tax=Nonlabens ulvanivorans TaxID=906888 RepID=UPI0032994124
MKQFLLMLIIASSTLISAQPAAHSALKNGAVYGRVIDAELNEPLPYVNIVISDMAKKIITGGITDDDGKFYIDNLPEGKILVSVQFVGFKTINQDITIGKANYKVDLGVISLEEASTGLDEVTIVADVSSIQQRVDRKVITIGKDLQTAGATASEIMNNLPAVSVDQQTGALSLRGNQNVRVMVDGKLSNIPAEQLLKQIPST